MKAKRIEYCGDCWPDDSRDSLCKRHFNELFQAECNELAEQFATKKSFLARIRDWMREEQPDRRKRLSIKERIAYVVFCCVDYLRRLCDMALFR